MNSRSQSCVINYNWLSKEDKHLQVHSNSLATIINQFCFSTKALKRSPVTKATVVYDGDANQELLVCLRYADNGLFSPLNRSNTTATKRNILRGHSLSHVFFLPMKWEWWISQLAHVFTREAITSANESTPAGFCTGSPKRCQMKSRADRQLRAERGENSRPSTEIHGLQRHIVDCVIARGRGGKGQDSKDISQRDLHLKSEHEIWTRCSVRRHWMANWLFFFSLSVECGD